MRIAEDRPRRLNLGNIEHRLECDNRRGGEVDGFDGKRAATRKVDKFWSQKGPSQSVITVQRIRTVLFVRIAKYRPRRLNLGNVEHRLDGAVVDRSLRRVGSARAEANWKTMTTKNERDG